LITAIDTNVLIDVFRNDPTHAKLSADALRRCLREGQIVACDIVWAELAGLFKSIESLKGAMRELPISYSPMNEDSAFRAGDAWRSYRAKGGSRAKVIADFLIAAHAQVQCDRLLTRDRGFYRAYFPKLRLMNPPGG